MDHKQFNVILDKQLEDVRNTLETKAVEYATGDRLHNFKKAANLRGTDAKDALGGMMVKHTVSIFDMIESQEYFSADVWAEKITDHINYLILLQAIVIDEQTDPSIKQESLFPDDVSVNA